MFGDPRQRPTTEDAESAELTEKEMVRVPDPKTPSFPASVLSVLSVVKNPDLSP
jgi:hypothetical protein